MKDRLAWERRATLACVAGMLIIIAWKVVASCVG